MNPFEMVVGIIIVVTIGNVLKARYGAGGKAARRSRSDDAATAHEDLQLKGEIGQLKERIAVLERVVTDNEGSLRLDREIEKLRDARHD
jgi:cell division protein FtsB